MFDQPMLPGIVSTIEAAIRQRLESKRDEKLAVRRAEHHRMIEGLKQDDKFVIKRERALAEYEQETKETLEVLVGFALGMYATIKRRDKGWDHLDEHAKRRKIKQLVHGAKTAYVAFFKRIPGGC